MRRAKKQLQELLSKVNYLLRDLETTSERIKQAVDDTEDARELRKRVLKKTETPEAKKELQELETKTKEEIDITPLTASIGECININRNLFQQIKLIDNSETYKEEKEARYK